MPLIVECLNKVLALNPNYKENNNRIKEKEKDYNVLNLGGEMIVLIYYREKVDKSDTKQLMKLTPARSLQCYHCLFLLF